MAFVITAVVLLMPIAPWFLWQLGRRIGLWCGALAGGMPRANPIAECPCETSRQGLMTDPSPAALLRDPGDGADEELTGVARRAAGSAAMAR